MRIKKNESLGNKFIPSERKEHIELYSLDGKERFLMRLHILEECVFEKEVIYEAK
jgi:hypothetical protein